MNVDDVVKNGYLPRKMIDYARDMRGTPEYEQLRHDPEYAERFRLLENGGGIYSLHAVTGPEKTQLVEAHRKAYFHRLKQYGTLGLLGLAFSYTGCSC